MTTVIGCRRYGTWWHVQLACGCVWRRRTDAMKAEQLWIGKRVRCADPEHADREERDPPGWEGGFADNH